MTVEITYVGGPRDGQPDSGEWVHGDQILTFVPSDIGGIEVPEGGLELAWHVYTVVNTKAAGAPSTEASNVRPLAAILSRHLRTIKANDVPFPGGLCGRRLTGAFVSGERGRGVAFGAGGTLAAAESGPS